MSRYFIDDEYRLVTIEDIKNVWETEKESGEYGSFGDYLNACMAHNNGTLTEISKEDAGIVSVAAYYHTSGNYGQTLHKGKEYTSYVFYLKHITNNGNDVSWDGVSFVAIDEDEDRIIQASGYTMERGLFCDVY